MHLVELLLPLTDNAGKRYGEPMFVRIREDLTDKFGGVTIFSRTPAHGISKEGGKDVHDDIVVMEVMTDMLDRDWWSDYRKQLEDEMKQREILMRASRVEKL